MSISATAVTPLNHTLAFVTLAAGPASTPMRRPASAMTGVPKMGAATNSPPFATTSFARASVVSGWMVELSMKSLPLTSPSRIVSYVSWTASSLATHEKMTSAREIPSERDVTTSDLPWGRLLLWSMARWVERLKRRRGPSRLPFSTMFLLIP